MAGLLTVYYTLKEVLLFSSQMFRPLAILTLTLNIVNGIGPMLVSLCILRVYD